MSATSMVENCKRRRSQAMGLAAQLYDSPFQMWMEEPSVKNALPFIDNIAWSCTLQILKKIIQYKFAVPGEESLKTKDLPRLSDALFQKLENISPKGGVPEIAEAYCEFILEQIETLVALTDVTPPLLLTPWYLLSRQRIILLKPAEKMLQRKLKHLKIALLIYTNM